VKPILYAITDRRLMGEDPVASAESLMVAGVDWLQVREKDLSDRDLFGLVAALSPLAARSAVALLVNGRPDIALAAGATGVHLPSEGLPTGWVRSMCPSPLLVVRSCHSVEDARRAQAEGADAVTLGPVFPTPSKAAFGEPMGLEAFSRACCGVEIPVLALGGVGPAEVPAVLAAGAAGVAAIRLFWRMGRPREEVPALRSAPPADSPPIR
jgi:thiamine-phosphate pyrophosphorylase